MAIRGGSIQDIRLSAPASLMTGVWCVRKSEYQILAKRWKAEQIRKAIFVAKKPDGLSMGDD